MRIAILITCYNRKAQTINCLKLLKNSIDYTNGVKFEIFLTDDMSSDGTKNEVKSLFPNVNLLIGTGNLYWSGGTRNSFNSAKKYNFDGYLLLNDDISIFKQSLNDLIESIDVLSSKGSFKHILIGSTYNSRKTLSYGAAIFINKFMGSYKKLYPNNTLQDCELGNANFMYVSKATINEVGFLYKKYQHGVADYDYTFFASKRNISVKILPKFIGSCQNHLHSKNFNLNQFKSLKNRYFFLMSPVGLAFKDNLIFQYRFFKYRIPFFLIFASFRLFFPKLFKP